LLGRGRHPGLVPGGIVILDANYLCDHTESNASDCHLGGWAPSCFGENRDTKRTLGWQLVPLALKFSSVGPSHARKALGPISLFAASFCTFHGNRSNTINALVHFRLSENEVTVRLVVGDEGEDVEEVINGTLLFDRPEIAFVEPFNVYTEIRARRARYHDILSRVVTHRKRYLISALT